MFIPTQRSPAIVDGKIDARVASAHSDDAQGSHASRLMEVLTRAHTNAKVSGYEKHGSPMSHLVASPHALT